MAVTLTWLGTNSLLVESPKTRFLVDPFIEMPGGENRNSLEDFLGVGTILVTHGHFDHLASVPLILREEPALVLGTECVTETLVDELEDELDDCDIIVTVEPGSEFDLDDVHVKVLQGKHIHFDAQLVARTLFPSNMTRARWNVGPILEMIRHYPEEGETVIYDTDIAGRRVQFMGSLAFADGVEYPTGADWLVMPYQGSTHLEPEARRAIEILQPKGIVLSHFDDAFPPVSQSVPLDGIREIMAKDYPEIRFHVPEFKVPFEL